MNTSQDILFKSSTSLVNFIIIEENLSQLYEYCYETLHFTEDKLTKLNSEIKKHASNHDNSDYLSEDDLLFDSDTYIEGLENLVIPQWQENFDFIAPSMFLVMLWIFLEKSLKDLSYSYTEGSLSVEIPAGEKFKIKVKDKESIIDASFRYLKDNNGFKFELDNDVYNLLNICRVVRNDFAHGDWINVKESIKKIELDEAFRTVSSIFYAIENGLPASSNNSIKNNQ